MLEVPSQNYHTVRNREEGFGPFQTLSYSRADWKVRAMDTDLEIHVAGSYGGTYVARQGDCPY